MSGSLSIFYSKVRDFNLIQSAFAKGMRQATVNRNINATTWGGEAGLSYHFADAWTIDGSLAYVHGTNDTDSLPLAQLPPLEGRIGLTYDNSVWTVGTLVRATAAQNQFAVNQGNIAGQDIGRTSGFAIVSLNAGWRVAKSFQLSAGVDNLLDKAFAEHISRSGSTVPGYTTTTRVNEPGRTVWVQAKIDL